MSDYLQFWKLDPMYGLNFPGKTMFARSDLDAMKAECYALRKLVFKSA